MKKSFCLLFVAALFFQTSCSSTDNEPSTLNSGTAGQQVSFASSIKKMVKAISSGFETTDNISVFAIKATSSNPNGELYATNYANNVEYTYSGSLFTSSNPIIYPTNGDSLWYHAVYPYQNNAARTFTFSIKKNQDQGSNYTLSDLMTSSLAATTELIPTLTFNHRLSNVIVNLTFEQATSEKISLKFCNIIAQVNVDLNKKTFAGVGKTDSVSAASNGTNSFRAVLAPQTIASGTNFCMVTVGKKKHFIATPGEFVWKSGVQYEYNLTIEKSGDISFKSEITPWNEPSDIEETVPPEILADMKPYVSIYSGSTPPNIEGCYFIAPQVTVYCQDEDNGGFQKGHIVKSQYIRFANQDNVNHTIEYSSKDSTGTSSASATSAFISGSGNNFTVYLNTEGETHNIYTKTALVISGIKTVVGITGLRYAFVMVDKGEDPDSLLMNEGVFRVFEDKDGIASIATWPTTVTKTLQKNIWNENNNVFSYRKRK